MWPMTGSMAERRRSSRLMTPKTPRFWPEMKTRRGFCCVVAAVSLVDIGALDRAAGELLGAVDDVPQACDRRKGCPAAPWHAARTGRRERGIGGDDRGLDAELVGRAGLALADAFDLGGMEGIKLPAALALLLRADLRGARQRPGERRLQFWPGPRSCGGCRG